jgi:hypothetical protein
VAESLGGKEVKTMTYNKPEIAVLGEAPRLIQGGKSIGGDDGSLSNPGTTDCELDD